MKNTMMCADPIAYVRNNGLIDYKSQFNNVVTPELLIAEEYYNEKFGPRVTKQHICDYIRYWGISDYINNCSPDSTYDIMMSDEDFCAAQMLCYKETTGVELLKRNRTIQMIQDPYYRNIRDYKGVLIPEPPNKYIENDFEFDKEYIYANGIVNYVLYSGTKKHMKTLLASRAIATWQRCYIERVLPLNASI